jgi:hypothetical protein
MRYLHPCPPGNRWRMRATVPRCIGLSVARVSTRQGLVADIRPKARQGLGNALFVRTRMNEVNMRRAESLQQYVRVPPWSGLSRPFFRSSD